VSTKEEALKRAMEQREGVRVRGEDLQHLAEEAVRKAFGKTRREEGEFYASIDDDREPLQTQETVEREIFRQEEGHSPLWYKGIHSLAINIRLKMGEGKKGAILFASSVSGEGTTTICAGTSRALAKVTGAPVLLLDCSAQQPGIHKVFPIEPVPGLTDVLLGNVHWEQAVRKSTLKNFFILPFGEPVPEPLSLLGSERMERLLEVLKVEFGTLFIDTSPILVSAEAEMIVPWVEASILVIKARATRREVVMRAVERMIQYKDFMGAVLNQQEFIIPQFLYKRLR
jgi:protein-tyrosine kinase